MKILISDAFDSSLPKKLARFGEVTDDKNLLSEAEVVLIRSKTKCTREYIDSASNLKLIIRGGVGLDNVDQEYASIMGIKVHNTPKASSVAVAEMAMALMMAMPNHLVKAHVTTQAGQWAKKELKRSELYEKTLGVIGCGRIGQLVAQRALGFGMTVSGCDQIAIHSEFIAKQKSLFEMLTDSDYLTLHLPLSDSTRNIIRKNTISKMKDGVRIVNTGRGALVAEQDIADALKSGKVAGYATDVFENEPPVGSPLLDAPNVLLTPHIGASSKENLLRIGDTVIELVEDYTNGVLV
jgi:D-3-phosphoglycerate dehydrogenase